MILLNLAYWITIAFISSCGSSTPSSNTKVAVRAKPVDGCTLKKSLPSSAICGQAGQLSVTSTSSNVTIAPQILSFQKCRDWCFHQQVISPGVSGSDNDVPSKYAFYYKGMYFYYDYYPYFEGYKGHFHIYQYLSTNTTAGESYIVSFEYRVCNIGGMIVSLGEYQWEEQLGNASTKPREFSRIFQGSGRSDSLELLFYGPGDDDTNHEQIVELDNFSVYQLAHGNM